MYITKEEIKKILAVMDEFPDARSYKLESDNSSGIGSITTLTMEIEIKGHNALVTLEIAGVETW